LQEFEKIEIDQDTWSACRDYMSELNQPDKTSIKKELRQLTEKSLPKNDIRMTLEASLLKRKLISKHTKD